MHSTPTPPTTEAARRCDQCGRELPAAKFKPKPRNPDERDATCRDCVTGSRIITCSDADCERTRRVRTRSRATTKWCSLHALYKKLNATKYLRPRKCWRCGTKAARLWKGDVECAAHYDANTWATGDCHFCGSDDYPIWSVAIPVCVRCVKDHSKRDDILNWLEMMLPPAARTARKAEEAEHAERKAAKREPLVSIDGVHYTEDALRKELTVAALKADRRERFERALAYTTYVKACRAAGQEPLDSREWVKDYVPAAPPTPEPPEPSPAEPRRPQPKLQPAETAIQSPPRRTSGDAAREADYEAQFVDDDEQDAAA